MAITLDHTIVPARNKSEAARFFTDILGLPPGQPLGAFVAVEVNPSLTFDFADSAGFESHHYAFFVSDEELDAILARVVRAEIPYSSDPFQKHVGELNHRHGGRGFYFKAPDGHVLEVLTRRS